ncbi:serine hydrolase [Rhodococcus hoagii]|nr:serine hydrolase [Prescottella equi]
MPATQGTCRDDFEPVRRELEHMLAAGEELGASICVTVDGEPVVDIWGGHTDTERTIVEFDMSALDPDSVMIKTLTSPLLDYTRTSDAAWRQAEIGAVNGHGNARSIARLQSIVSNSGVLDGRNWLSGRTIDAIFRQQSSGLDLALMAPLRFGIGYGLPHPLTAPAVPAGRVCWWTGVGGSFVVNDLDRRVTFAYAMNKMAPEIIGSERANAYLRATFGAIA